MGVAQKKSTPHRQLLPEQLKFFVPVYSLDSERLKELIRHASVLTLPAGTRLYNRGDTDNRIYYLLSGAIELRGGSESKSIEAGTEEAKLPIDPHQPRQFSVTMSKDSEIVIIDRSLLDILLTWDPYAGYSVNELGDNDDDSQDWMSTMLLSKVFQKVPPVNIQTLFQRLQHVPVQAGDIIFYEGDDGEDCYFIRSGECEVLRLSGNQRLELVTTLIQGQSFGEEALLTNRCRNATIRMRTEGALLRLNKQDFDDLLKMPIVKAIDFETAEALITQGARWIDVRQPEEQTELSMPNSLHIPLNDIRAAVDSLDSEQTYVLYCDTGQRSACAAYLLNAYGYQAYILENGLMPLTDSIVVN